MSKDEWYSKLNKWAHEDSRLERMPLVYLRVLAEHIANEQAVEHRVHTDEGEAEAQEARPNQLDTGEGWGPSGNRPRG